MLKLHHCITSSVVYLQAYPHIDRSQGRDQQCPVQLRLFPHSHGLYGQDLQDMGDQSWYVVLQPRNINTVYEIRTIMLHKSWGFGLVIA